MPAAVPAAVAFFGGTAFTVGGVAVTYGAIAKAAILIGSVAYSQAQASKLRRSLNTSSLDQGRNVMVRDPIAPRRLIYGRVPVSGTIVFIHTTGTKNEYLHLVVVLAGHEVDAITDIYFNEDIVELDGSNLAVGKYAGYARVVKHLGTVAEAADANLISETGGLWTSNHKLGGCAYLAVRLKWSPDLFPNGLPTIKALVRGKKVYDPRTTATVHSPNSALCIADYLKDTTFGKGIALARIRSADCIEAANICDESIVLGVSVAKVGDMVTGNRHIGCADVSGIYPGLKVAGTGIPAGTVVVSIDPSGTFFTVDQDPTATNATAALTIGDTEARYECNGTITSDQDPGDVLRDLAGSMAGFVVDTGGTWTIRAGAHRSSSLALGDSDLIGPFSMQPRQSRQDTFNRVRGVYISPANQWAPADFPAVSNTTYKANDGGVWLDRDVQYNFTTSPAMAQRLAKIELERGRQQITVNAPYNLKAMACMPGDVVSVTRDRLGWSSKLFEVSQWEDANGGDGVQLSYRETAAAVWDWSDGEETLVDLAPNTTLPDPFTVATPSTPTLASGTANAYVQADGTVVPRLKVSWTTPNDIHVEQGGKVRIEYKPTAGGTWYVWNEVRGDVLEDYITDVRAGVGFDVRLQFENNAKVRGAYSTTAAHTVTGDTSALSAPTSLTATAGDGALISLDWADITDTRLGEYGVYRHTSNVFGSATKIAEVRASRFVDTDISLSTTYYYWVTAYTASEVESSPSTGANATTGSGAGVSTTPPSDPSAPTYSSNGTYSTGDGTVRAYIVISMPALPSGAVGMYLRYRINGSTAAWTIADYLTAGSGTVRIDDLAPGSSYAVSVIAISAFGYASNSVAATGSPFTAPNTTGGPSAPAWGVFTTDAPAAKDAAGTGYQLGVRASWAPVADAALSYYEIKSTTTDSDGATDYNFGTSRAVFPNSPTTATMIGTEYNFYSESPAPNGYVRVRAVNRSGVASAWLRIGNAVSTAVAGAANMALQASSDVTVTGVKTGGAGARKVIARYQETQVFTLAGGAAYEDEGVSISGKGFTTKPDIGAVQVASSDTVGCYYNYDNGSNSSSAAWIKFHTYDGSNIAAGNYRVSIEFVEYD